jgi:hypothetical protein
MKLLYTIFACCALLCGGAPEKTDETIELPPFSDTYRWHPYHLTKVAPVSEDGVFRLLSVAKNGDVRLHYIQDDVDILIKRSASPKEIMNSKMPMRVVRSDYKSQSTDFEWLTTN